MTEEIQFVDPETHAPLHLAGEAELQALRDFLKSGRATSAVDVPAFEGAYLTPDGSRAFLVTDGLANFLLDERIDIAPPLGAAP